MSYEQAASQAGQSDVESDHPKSVGFKLPSPSSSPGMELGVADPQRVKARTWNPPESYSQMQPRSVPQEIQTTGYRLSVSESVPYDSRNEQVDPYHGGVQRSVPVYHTTTPSFPAVGQPTPRSVCHSASQTALSAVGSYESKMRQVDSVRDSSGGRVVHRDSSAASAPRQSRPKQRKPCAHRAESSTSWSRQAQDGSRITDSSASPYRTPVAQKATRHSSTERYDYQSVHGLNVTGPQPVSVHPCPVPNQRQVYYQADGTPFPPHGGYAGNLMDPLGVRYNPPPGSVAGHNPSGIGGHVYGPQYTGQGQQHPGFEGFATSTPYVPPPQMSSEHQFYGAPSSGDYGCYEGANQPCSDRKNRNSSY